MEQMKPLAGNQKVEDIEELVGKILLSLPLKKICQCQVVSKLWKTMISQPLFNQMVIERDCPPNIFVRYLDFPQKVGTIHFSDLNNYSVENFELPDKFNDILGSCNGLVCLGDESERHILFLNPCTKWIQMIELIEEPTHTFDHCGFGYDETRKDFKLVLVHCPTEINRSKQVPVHAVIFSIRDNGWRDICYERWGFILASSPANFVDGKLYWKGILWETPEDPEAEEVEEVLITFDIGTETFGSIKVPEQLCGQYVNFGVIGNKLCACLCAEDTSIWFLHDDNFERRMTLVNYKRNLACSLQPLYSHGDSILLLRAKRKITMYNMVEDAKVQIMGFDKIDPMTDVIGFDALEVGHKPRMKAIGFVESLFPLKYQRDSGKHDELSAEVTNASDQKHNQLSQKRKWQMSSSESAANKLMLRRC